MSGVQVLSCILVQVVAKLELIPAEGKSLAYSCLNPVRLVVGKMEPQETERAGRPLCLLTPFLLCLCRW